MSVINQELEAGAPVPSLKRRSEVTRAARRASTPGDWLSLVLDHHDLIRAAFEACRAAEGEADRTTALARLAMVLNGHALAEEIVLYPALARAGEQAHAAQAYLEQSAAKMQMAELETTGRSSRDWVERVEHVEGGVLIHMFEEESGWFLQLKDRGEDQDRLTARYAEEYDRYVSRRVGQDAGDTQGATVMTKDQTDGRKANGATPGGKPDASTSGAAVRKTGQAETLTAGPDGPDATVVGDTFKQKDRAREAG